MKVIDKLAWIEIQDKKILSTRSKGKTVWYIPGGKREENESDIAALTREIKEELNVDLLEESIEYVGTFEAQADGHATGVIVKMQCYSSNYSGQLQASSEIAEMAWLDRSDWDRIAAVDKIIFTYLHQRNLIN